MDSCSMSYVLCKFTYSSGQLLNSEEDGISTCTPITESLLLMTATFFFKSLGLSTLREKKKNLE